MASAGIRKTPTGRYKVWWRLADASQGSQTFATRDQARDFKHDLLARLAHGNSVDPQLGRQTFETLGARVVGRLVRQSRPQPTDSPSRRGAPAAALASARAIRRRGRRGWLPRRLLGRGKRRGSRGRNDVPERSLHDD